MISSLWKMLKDTVLSFIDDEVLSRGAAIAFYTVTSIAPVLLIVIAIAGLVFGRDAAQNALSGQFSGLMGRQTADVLQSAIASAADKSSSIIATIIGVTTLVATASGVFGEMQAALNSIWKTKSQATTVSRLIRARVISLGLVAAMGFFAYGLACNQRRTYGVRQLFGHCVADGKTNPSSAELFCVLSASWSALWRNL
jgi:membrane protein